MPYTFSTGIPAVEAYEEENNIHPPVLPSPSMVSTSVDPWHGWTAQMGTAGVPEPQIVGMTDCYELDKINAGQYPFFPLAPGEVGLTV